MKSNTNVNIILVQMTHLLKKQAHVDFLNVHKNLLVLHFEFIKKIIFARFSY